MVMHRRTDKSVYPSAGQVRRRAFSLLEVIAALTLTAALATVSTSGFRSTALSSVSNATSAQSLALELSRTRRLAIHSGESHGVRFLRSGKKTAGYVLFRRTDAGAEIRVSEERSFPPDTRVSFAGSAIEFDPEGCTARHHTVRFTSAERSWQISVVPVTGTARVTEL